MSTVIAMPAAPVSRGQRLAELLLVRLLLPAKRPPALKKVAADVGKLFRGGLEQAQVDEAVARLREQQELEPKALRLTEAGRTQALRVLGVPELPAKSTWATLQTKFLLPLALGLDPEQAKAIKGEQGLAAHLLKRHFQLTPNTGKTLAAVLESIACKELGYGDITTFKELKDVVLSELVSDHERLTVKQLTKQVPRVVLAVRGKGAAGMREAAFMAWTDSPPAETPVPPAEAAEFDLPAFAHTVLAAARECPTGKFGDNKVFINHVWRWLREEPALRSMDLAEFKHRLLDANAAHLLTLSRADLVQVMNPEDVAESETVFLNALFHFILLEREGA